MWYYENRLFDVENDLGGNIGFVYLITNLTNNKKYIGKKLFEFTRTKKVKGKKKKTKIQSDWVDYFGSNRVLQTDVERLGPDKFRRTILRLCKSKGTCNYWEAYEIMIREAITSDEYYNEWLSVKVSRSQIKF